MMRLRRMALVAWAMVPNGTMAQPTELFDCLGPGTDRVYCAEISSADLMDLTCVGDPRIFELYTGRIAWAPLKYVGPITIEVNARPIAGTRFPLYIEFVDVKNYSAGTAFCDGAGSAAGVIMEVHGSQTCEGWETLTTFDLGPWGMAIGDPYVIRAHFFNDPDLKFTSPYLGCIRVRPATTPVVTGLWGQVKSLYR